MSVHTLAVAESPSVHTQSASTEQVDDQPSLSFVFPSSQYPAVGLNTSPSPHTSSCVQISAVEESPPEQVQPTSSLQEESQPSLSLVFPSSHFPIVESIFLPSPQMSEHTLAVAESPSVHDQYVSTPQIEDHPSPSAVLPSSQ